LLDHHRPYPGTPYFDLAQPHPGQAGVWTYTHPGTGDRLHAREVDFLRTADYYKGDPQGGYKSFVFTDFMSSEALVQAARPGGTRGCVKLSRFRSIRRGRRCGSSIPWVKGYRTSC